MKKNSKNNKLCLICESEATCLCFECTDYFCDSCFKLIHEKKSQNNHNKEKIDPFVPIDVKCLEHPKILMNLFCLDEKGTLILFNKYNLYFPNYRTLLYILLLQKYS